MKKALKIILFSTKCNYDQFMEEATKPTKLMYGICVLDCVFAVK